MCQVFRQGLLAVRLREPQVLQPLLNPRRLHRWDTLKAVAPVRAQYENILGSRNLSGHHWAAPGPVGDNVDEAGVEEADKDATVLGVPVALLIVRNAC